jgi:acetyl-CoA carboxylase carboxyl transferase subunit alpha
MDTETEKATPPLSEEDQKAFSRVNLARHPDRPYALDYIEAIFSDFIELKGDRRFGEDPALVGGFAVFNGSRVLVIGQQKGRDTKQRRFRNFGMPKPEGYRKTLRLMRLAEKFGRPIITLIDTPGAYPGIDAEERGQAEAIARNLLTLPRLGVPIIVTIIGEGGSGGALAIGVGDQALMLENAIYSVISPEGCAAILWKNSDLAPHASASLKLTAEDLLKLGVIDEIVSEPAEGAHKSIEEATRLLENSLRTALEKAKSLSNEERLERRYQKLRKLGL